MLRDLKLERYRGFDEYELSDLSRVNLLVGRNDCGKTSILEAIHFLVSRGDPEVLARCAERRGESTDVAPRGAAPAPSPAEAGSRPGQAGPSIARFFRGHRFGPEESFRISGEGRGCVSVDVRLHDESLPPADDRDPPVFDLLIRSTLDKPFGIAIPVTETGYMVNYRRHRFRGPWLDRASPAPAVQFVTLDSLDGEALREAWDTALKEGREAEAIEAVRLMHEDLESIVVLTSDSSRTGSGRAGVLLGFGGTGRRERVPLGSHGDGMHRLLALSLALIQAADGVLLIDEIDTGLHWTVLDDMWRLVIETARKSSMQVFATTHSYDCIRGLAALVESRPDLASDVSIHKIGRSICKAVHLDAEDLQVAVEQNIEMR